MRTEPACLPCFFRQVSRTLDFAGVNGDRAREITREARRIIEDASFDQPPARITTVLHRLLREASGADPYRAIKDEYNRIALEMLPAVRAMASVGDDGPGGDARLGGAVRAAIAGNIIDFGIYDQIDIERSLSDSFALPLDGPAFQELSRAVRSARRILYLCDNAGEVAFDRVLIDVLRQQGGRVTAAVKGSAVINDATLEDADAVGLGASADEVIDNGSDGIGTLLEQCSPRFLEACRSADLIISKGQANYETLSTEQDDRLFFLFKVKCPVVADGLGRENGGIMLLDNRRPVLQPAG